MKFNYRILHTYHPPMNKHDAGTDQYAVHKVYYDDEGDPVEIAAMPMRPITDDIGDLRKQVEQMAKAVELPTLNADEYGGLIKA
jgi:ATP-dependent 26S proteasome regulatory subunit